jgi:hypothetical protein
MTIVKALSNRRSHFSISAVNAVGRLAAAARGSRIHDIRGCIGAPQARADPALAGATAGAMRSDIRGGVPMTGDVAFLALDLGASLALGAYNQGWP